MPTSTNRQARVNARNCETPITGSRHTNSASGMNVQNG